MENNNDVATCSSPEFQAFSRAKSHLVRQLSYSLTLLKDDCRGSIPQLLSFDEDQAIFGAHGSTPVQETSKLLDVVLARIQLEPSAYHAFRTLRVLNDGANHSLALLMDKLLAEEIQKQVKTVGAEPLIDNEERTAYVDELESQPLLASDTQEPSSQEPVMATHLELGEDVHAVREDSKSTWKRVLFIVLIFGTPFLVAGGMTLIIIGCLGLSGEESCSFSKYGMSVSKLFNIHNLFFGLVCFSTPVIPCSVVGLKWIYKSTSQCRPATSYCTVIIGIIVGIYILLVICIVFTSLFSIIYASIFLSSDDSDSVCSHLTVYTALISSSLLCGPVVVVLTGLIIFLITYVPAARIYRYVHITNTQ